jgi:hypothetical protein
LGLRSTPLVSPARTYAPSVLRQAENLVGRDGYADVADDLRRRLLARMSAAGEKEPTIDSAWG